MQRNTAVPECDATIHKDNVDPLRWAGCSDVQIPKICLEVSEPFKIPFEVPLKIPLYLTLQKSLQVPVQEAPLQVETI
ncbi:hypothetical protein INR49_001522 [Caranx melampygus]|nr:hypothetical protein INR49_001522 [Caranx melampygus]